MPWEVTGPVRERERFIETYLSGLYSISELADRFNVSRQKLHKWLARHNAGGMPALADQSRAPHKIPHRTNDDIADQIIAFRRRFPHMGPRKIIARLTELHPHTCWPGAEYGRRHSSACETRHRPRTPSPERTSAAFSQPAGRTQRFDDDRLQRTLSAWRPSLLLPAHDRRSRQPVHPRLRSFSVERIPAHPSGIRACLS